MTTTVGRIYRFRAIHSLPDFPEPWCWPHQHDYTVEVIAIGGTPTDDIDKAWMAVQENLDGANLNEMFSPSTVEHIAERLLDRLPMAIAVTVWEDQARWGRTER